ncbi:MAG: RnfABCDGE type electron transport complex subunit D [Bacteroidia bacterium]
MNIKSISGKLFRDARNLQIIFLSVFLIYGIWALDWTAEAQNFFIVFPVAALTQLLAIWHFRLSADSLKSAVISALGISILFRSDNMWMMIFVAFAAIAGKFLIRFRGKHIFNPGNFGIILTILLFQDGWISPGKWGSSVILLLMIASAGLMVLFKAGRIDTGVSFLITLFILDFFRLIIYQGWTADVLFHKYMNGSLLLFSFFMITDPATTPNHPRARIIWSALIAVITFSLQSFMQIHTAPLWTLFFISPLTQFLI